MLIKAIIIVVLSILSQNSNAGVTIFSSPGCGPCAEAKQYMRQNNIKFEECSISKPQCAQRFARYGTDGGTPLIIVNGKKMEGWDPNTFEGMR